MNALPLSRRQFVATAATATLPAFLRADEPNAKAEPVAFFVVGDTHYFADKDTPTQLDARSKPVTGRLIDTLNKLPGAEIPKAAGGGSVRAAKGVIHAGDCIDSGDKPKEKMQRTEWAAFADDYGLTGTDGRLKLPVYEILGNHDSPHGVGLAVGKVAARNKTRPSVGNVSPNGVHYSWDWNGVHFVNLGLIVGQVATVTRKRRYAPLDSLAFLIADLKEKVGTSGKPVVITHHVDILRYAQPLPVDDKKAAGMEWDPADVKGFHDALKGYSVAAIFYGHTHARNVFRWDGSNKAAAAGIPVFNVDNSAHFGSKAQAFYYCEIADGRITVREYATSDGWETGTWTPQTWVAPTVTPKG